MNNQKDVETNKRQYPKASQKNNPKEAQKENPRPDITLPEEDLSEHNLIMKNKSSWENKLLRDKKK